jgi:Ion channel
MFTVLLACLAVISVTTLIHYEVLSALDLRLPAMRIPHRSKLLVVMAATVVAHIVEIAVWGVVMWLLTHHGDAGSLRTGIALTMTNCIYFSAEAYTSLGFGADLPEGPLRLLIGLEALNGLLLIAWSASFTYLAMEKFWSGRRKP